MGGGEGVQLLGGRESADHGHLSPRMLLIERNLNQIWPCGWCFEGWFKQAGLCSTVDAARKQGQFF